MNKEHNIQHYTEQFKLHGNDFRSLNWGSEKSQQKRFKVLSEIGDLAGCSITDVGCGLGHFFTWLEQQKIETGKKVGIDITPCMVSQASENNPKAQFVVADILKDEFPVSDFVFSSGVFTYCLDDSYQFLELMVQKMFEKSVLGLAFNCLSSHFPEQSEKEFYADPLRVFQFCQSLSPWVTLRHDYHLGDFTIYVRKESR